MARPVSINFEGVESGGGSVHIPEGDYGFKIVKVISKKAKESGNPLLLFSLKAIAGPKAGIGKVLPHNCTLTKQSLWNLRNLLEATGREVPSKAIKIDLDKLINNTLAGTVIDDEYKGRKKSIVSAFFPMEELQPDEPEEKLAGEDEPGEEEEGGEEGTTEESEDEELF